MRDWGDKGGQQSQQSVLERRESLRENPETGMQTMPLENVANDQYMHAKNYSRPQNKSHPKGLEVTVSDVHTGLGIVPISTIYVLSLIHI